MLIIQGNMYDLVSCSNCDYKAAYKLKEDKKQ